MAGKLGFGDVFQHLFQIVEMWHLDRGCMNKLLYTDLFTNELFLPFYQKYTGKPDATYPIEKYMTYENASTICGIFLEAWMSIRQTYVDESDPLSPSNPFIANIGINAIRYTGNSTASLSEKLRAVQQQAHKFVVEHADLPIPFCVQRALYSDGCADELLLITVFDHIIPFLLSFLDIIRSGSYTQIMDALLEMQRITHILHNTNFENALLSCINNLQFAAKHHPKALAVLMENISACVGVYIEYIHGKLASSLPHHKEPTVDLVNRTLALIPKRNGVAEKMKAVGFGRSRTVIQVDATKDKYKVSTCVIYYGCLPIIASHL